MTRRSFLVAAAALVGAQVIGCAAAQAYCGTPSGTNPAYMGYTLDEPALLARNYRSIDSGGYAGWLGSFRKYCIQSELQYKIWFPRLQNQSYRVSREWITPATRVYWAINRKLEYPRVEKLSFRTSRVFRTFPSIGYQRVGNTLSVPRFQNRSMMAQGRGWHGGRIR